jgi:hypothetical protein
LLRSYLCPGIGSFAYWAGTRCLSRPLLVWLHKLR